MVARSVFLLALLAFAFLTESFPANAAETDFNRDIRPILSDNCYLCHGPAESTREADLRLDDREAAIESGALVPGEAENSEVISRIFSDDEDLQMPPANSHKQLSSKQRELLRQWVDEGAEYQVHWAFVPPTKSEKLDADEAIDFFVERKLDDHEWKLSPQADPRTLIRRVSLDLTGVVPTPEEVARFVRSIEVDGFEQAYDRVVDRLLASSAYSERMTLAWLDAARFGDTSVMHADGPRDMWPWRDWVLNAYNSNMPFDQFTVEQLAGDLLPDATLDQKIASGFNRNHATSDEGGAFAEELRVEYVVDRVQTTSTVWMGLTMECAQCHDHKYDPLSQKEYYQFFAYFNNTTDPGMQTRKGNQTPVVDVADPVKEQKLEELAGKIRVEREKLAKLRSNAEPEFVTWVKKATEDLSSDKGGSKDLVGLAHWFSLDPIEGKSLKNNLTGSVATVENGKLATAQRDSHKALKLDGKARYLCGDDAPKPTHNEPFSFAAWIKNNENSSGAVFARMDVGNGHRGFDMWIQGGSVGTHVINKWPQNALKVLSKEKLAKDKWQHVVVSYDGSQKASGIHIYIDGKRTENTVEADSLTDTIETDVPFVVGSRSQGGNWKGGVDDIRYYDRELSEEEVPLAKANLIDGILRVDELDRSEAQVSTLRNHFFTSHDGLRKARKQLTRIETERAKLAAKKLTSMIMTDNPADKTRVTYILDRGQYDAPIKDEPISPGVPQSLPPLPNDAPANRLGLAKWLVAPNHPLTSRVAINRYWTMLFGNGFVRTSGDFGAQGTAPTHPELLDWLARDFIDSGWDIKRMMKTLVMSKTYRQSSRIKPEHLKKDPGNYLLARSPRFRLQGEFIRDQALVVSGLLVDQLGGPSVKPYQPENIWNEVSLNGGLRYSQDKGGKLYRKSMYTYWKRSAPMPNMLIFDAPSREKCVVQRARTNTPLQALVTLNDPQFVEAARAFAQRLIHAHDETEVRFDLAYQLATSRSVTEHEVAVLNQTLKSQRERFMADPDRAKAFLSVGESPRDESIDLIEHAAWTVIAQMILNLDETLTRG